MTLLNAFNPLFQVVAALVIFVAGFFALFLSVVTAVLLMRLGYVGASWALSKGVTAYAQRRGEVGVLVAHENGITALGWRDRLSDALAAPKFR